MSWQEDRHRALGLLGGEPLGQSGIVVVEDDRYLPDLRQEGVAGAAVAAAAGFRSEVALLFSGLASGLAYRIRRCWIATHSAAQNVEVVRVPSITGFTDSSFVSADTRAGRPKLRIQTKNTAAATGNGTVILASIHCLVGSEYVPPGGLLLNGLLVPGGEALIFRPTVDNSGIRVLFEWQELETRKL